MKLNDVKKTTDEIERESGRFLESILEKAFQSINKKLRPYRLGELKEKGIDFIFEIEERSKADVTQDVIPASNPMIYIQNKGTEALIKQLKKGKRSGKISFQLDDVRQLEYFCFELDQPLFITLCDLTQSQIYWLPVQLETLDYIEGIEAIKNAVKNGERSTSSIYIYFDPEKHLLDGEGKLIQAKVEDFISDHFTAKDSIIDKYINARRNSVSQSALYGMIDQTQHVLDQLYQLCKIVYDEIEYVPPEVLMNLPPFLPKEEEEKKTRYKMFSYNSKNTIITERADLFQMLDKLEIEDGNIKILDNELFKRVKDYREKITYVLKKLTNNHLFSIRHNHNTKDLFYSENNSCDCIRCRYENFDLKGVAEKLGKIPKSNMEEHIMAGYVQFKLGNFGSSAELLLKALELAKEEDQKLSQFIIYHNLKCLPAPRDEFGILNEELEAKLREINLEERYCEFTTIPMKGVVEEIYKGIYVKRAYDGITKLSSKIVTQYHESKNGGTSHNGYVSSLIVYYRRYIYFLRNNLLFTQNIDVPSQLSELYIEGLYASHATVGEGSRLVHFNDGILNELLVNSNSEALMKSFYRYSLKNLFHDYLYRNHNKLKMN